VIGSAWGAPSPVLSCSPFPVSSYPLPQYPVPLFFHPDGGYLYSIRHKGEQQFVRIVQGIINIILPVLLLLLCWFFHFPRWPVILAGLAILSLLPFLLFRGTELPVSFTRSFWLAMLVFAFVNFGLYPAILRYQAGTQAGRWISRTRAVGTDPGIGISRTQGISAVYLLREAPVNYSFEFYSPVPVRTIPVDSLPATLSNGPAIVFALPVSAIRCKNGDIPLMTCNNSPISISAS